MTSNMSEKWEDENRKDWEKDFFNKFGANKIWVTPSKENVETVLDIWAFIEHLLSQEKARLISEVNDLDAMVILGKNVDGNPVGIAYVKKEEKGLKCYDFCPG